MLLDRAFPPQALAGIFYLGAGLGLLGIRALRRGRAREAPLRSADVPWLALAILSGGVVAPALLMIGLSRTSASAGALLLNFEAVFTVLLARFALGEEIRGRVALGIVAVVAGGVVLAWPGTAGWNGLGGLFVAASCLAWGIDNVLTQRISGSDPVQITGLKGIVAGTINLVLASVIGVRVWPDAPALAAALATGLLCYGVSLVLYVRSLRHMGAARTGAYFGLAPFFGAAIAVMVLREAVTPILLGSAAIMGVGLWLLWTERHEHSHQHEELVHDHLHVHDEHHLHAHESGDPAGEPHAHQHRHLPLAHSHPHHPDLHHRHGHEHGRGRRDT